MMLAIRGQPNRGLRDLSSTMAWMSAWSGPFGPGFPEHDVDENVLASYQRLMKRQKRRRAERDGDLSDAFGTEEERPESAEQPVARRQIRRAPASTTQDDQLLFEQEILRHHRTHAAAATQLRGRHGQVQQGEQEILHVSASA
jgi:hypothetical protein